MGQVVIVVSLSNLDLHETTECQLYMTENDHTHFCCLLKIVSEQYKIIVGQITT